ncbi:hypothetical protein QZM46_05930 [Burkholderia vietnamiensis]|uniref:Uncharacterized protein n=1 Tax=Burkholderia vietnamiensis TaxID=60552 RepID=A0AAW7T583_BURVI|nr:MULTISPECIES: hypothetical protein [Burkholderia]MDN7410865.1 hypothetical protein [Burkholderia vietnamiensis]MDN7550884.1 hypothetical protein [Burkholderia vietnamiensis]MDN7665371.1 hypothetical protein [Burkholderia vietnamiensis]MDN7797420.1 hypothetical protein [Burkholderia vietnamiensis]MDN7816030.1 hypothetical protein [Burkholderia vietnamiensis]
MKLLIWIRVDALGETLREPESASPAAAVPGSVPVLAPGIALF